MIDSSQRVIQSVSMCFFFNDTATTEIYTLSLHDALPIYRPGIARRGVPCSGAARDPSTPVRSSAGDGSLTLDTAYHVRSEEHTSELQSRQYLVCRLLLEKKK